MKRTMKRILLLVIILLPIICNAQRSTRNYKNNHVKNLFTGWYGNQQSYMLEYSRHFAYDGHTSQDYGMDIGIGYNFKHYLTKVSIGAHSVVTTPSTWNPIYKMGIVVYGSESYDVFFGGGVEKNRMHLLTKFNLINLATGNFDGEWVEAGFGFSF